MKRITIIEPLPWNDHKGLYLETNIRLEPEAKLIIDHDGQETEINLDKSDLVVLKNRIAEILKGEEVSNG